MRRMINRQKKEIIQGGRLTALGLILQYMAITRGQAKKRKIWIENNSSSSSSSSSCSWSNLPDDIVCMIMNRLPYADQLYFRAACKSWREAKIHRAGPLKYKYADELPWMMAIDDSQSSCHLLDPFHKRKYTIHNETTMQLFGEGTSVLASRHGWLLVAKEKYPHPYDSLFLYSPFTGKTIQLPDLPGEITQLPCRTRDMRHSLAITFTASPDSKDCEVVVVRLLNTTCKQVLIRMCRPGDTTWDTPLRFDISDHLYPDKKIPSDFNFDTAYVNGVVYCLFGVSSVGAFIVATKQWKVFPYPPIHETHCRLSFAHISEWDGNYLLLSHYVHDLPEGFVFYRLQFDPSKSRLMEEDGEKDYWVEVKSLNNRSLFLGDNDTSLLFPVGEATGLANTVHHWKCYDNGLFYHANAIRYDDPTPCPQISQIYDWDVLEHRVLWIQPPDQPNF